MLYLVYSSIKVLYWIAMLPQACDSDLELLDLWDCKSILSRFCLFDCSLRWCPDELIPDWQFNQDRSPGCLDSPCCLQLCFLHSCVVDPWVILAVRLPENVGEESDIRSAQWISLIAHCFVANTVWLLLPVLLPAESGIGRLGPMSPGLGWLRAREKPIKQKIMWLRVAVFISALQFTSRITVANLFLACILLMHWWLAVLFKILFIHMVAGGRSIFTASRL